MVNFGARLSLKDNMSATLQKNLKLQKQFTEQVEKTNASVKKFGKNKGTATLSVDDNASKVIKKVSDAVKTVDTKKATPEIKAKDNASSKFTGILSKMSLLAKGVTIAVGIVGAGASLLLGGALSGGAMLEQQQISIEHFIGVNNRGSTQADIQKMADSYLQTLRDNANLTPFTTNEVISAGTRALNVAQGNTGEAEKLLRVAEDMASLNPEKSLSDAIEAIADMKNGETERMKEFGFKISQEDINKAGGAMAVIENQLAPYFAGGSAKLAGSAQGMVSTIKGKLSSSVTDTGLAMIEKSKPLLESIIVLIDTLAPKMTLLGGAVAEGFSIAVTWVRGLVENLGGLSPVVQNLQPVIALLGSVVSTVMPVISTIFLDVRDKIGQVVMVVQSHMGLFRSIFETVAPIVTSAITIIANVLSTTWSTVSSILNTAISVFDALLSCVEAVFPTIQGIIQGVWSVLEGILNGLAGGISAIGGAVQSLSGWISGGANALSSALGFAYGKGRVPYDNYPALLHQGEKVLTKNQAEQYERSVSTRGLSFSVMPLEQLSKAGTGIQSVTVEKLADTIVIEKEADVDKVVTEMVDKFKKLVPNMP